MKRFDFANETLIAIQHLDPQNLGDSLVPLFNLFPEICEGKIEEVEMEWRGMIRQKFIPKTLNLQDFWGNLFQLKNSLDELMYPNLKLFVGSLLSLPHSSAAAERIFSDLNNIKNKNRNSLKTKTINALLITKQIVNNISLNDWTPSKNILKKYNLTFLN